jgi:hypothetical protein
MKLPGLIKIPAIDVRSIEWRRLDPRKFDYTKLDPRQIDLNKFDPRKPEVRRQWRAGVQKRADYRMLAIVLSVIAALLAIGFVIKAGTVLYTVMFTKSSIQKVIEGSQPTAQANAKRFDEIKKHADKIKAKNYFNPSTQAPPVPPVVNGILGDKALIGGKWYAAGETANDAKIKSVADTYVMVEWQGKELKLSPINAPVPPPQQPGQPPVAAGAPSQAAQPPATGSAQIPPQFMNDPRITPEMRARMMEQMQRRQR